MKYNHRHSRKETEEKDKLNIWIHHLDDGKPFCFSYQWVNRYVLNTCFVLRASVNTKSEIILTVYFKCRIWLRAQKIYTNKAINGHNNNWAEQVKSTHTHTQLENKEVQWVRFLRRGRVCVEWGALGPPQARPHVRRGTGGEWARVRSRAQGWQSTANPRSPKRAPEGPQRRGEEQEAPDSLEE